MGPLLVLVSPCLRENVVVTCKTGSFLCSFDNLLQKNIIVFFFGNQISKWRSFEKGLFLTYFSHFLVTREKLRKFLQHISHSHTYMYFGHPIDFFALPILEKKKKKKKPNLSDMVSLWYDSWCWFLFAPFWNNQLITKWWAKCKLECLLLICIYANAKFIVICKPRTLNDGDVDSVKYRNRKKHCFLAAAILLFIGKIIITW